MKVLVTGATGLVGQALLKKLVITGKYDVRILSRDKKKAKSSIDLPVNIFQWDVESGFVEPGALQDIEAIIHLAGENVAAGRWSKQRKRKIMSSREKGSQLLIGQIKSQPSPPRKLISSSAVGIYGIRDDEKIGLDGSLGGDFLAEVCKKWEANILNHGIANMSAHCLRTGVVLSRRGGALAKMLPPFQMGLGGKLGTGEQFIPIPKNNDRF